MIISFANQKGGVGKTTSCVNLAAGVAEKKKKVLLLDFDPQGNASSGLGIDKRKLACSSYDLLINQLPIDEVIIASGRGHLDLCPANIDLAGAEIELVTQEGREYILRTALKEARERYDYIFIDCPPSLGLLTINALTASDGVIIPIQAEYYALEGLTQLLETVTAVKKGYNKELRVLGAMITMFDARTQLSKQVAEEIENFFKELTFKTFVPRNVRLSEAPSHGKTVFEYEKWSKGARAYEALSKEFLKRAKSWV